MLPLYPLQIIKDEKRHEERGLGSPSSVFSYAKRLGTDGEGRVMSHQIINALS